VVDASVGAQPAVDALCPRAPILGAAGFEHRAQARLVELLGGREQAALHQDAAGIPSLGSADLGVALHDDLGQGAPQPRIHQGSKHRAPGLARFCRGARFVIHASTLGGE